MHFPHRIANLILYNQGGDLKLRLHLDVDFGDESNESRLPQDMSSPRVSCLLYTSDAADE